MAIPKKVTRPAIPTENAWQIATKPGHGVLGWRPSTASSTCIELRIVVQIAKTVNIGATIPPRHSANCGWIWKYVNFPIIDMVQVLMNPAAARQTSWSTSLMYSQHAAHTSLPDLLDDITDDVFERGDFYMVNALYSLTSELDKVPFRDFKLDAVGFAGTNWRFESVKRAILNTKRSIPAALCARVRASMSPLFASVLAGRFDIARFLLEREADPNDTFWHNASVLHELAKSIRPGLPESESTRIYLAFFETVIDLGADVNARNYDRRGGIYGILHNRRLDPRVVEICCRRYVSSYFHARHALGSTVLHAFNGTVEVCKIMVDHGADVRATDMEGRTALHREKLPSETASLLVHSGADLEARDNFGRTPISYAHDPEYFEISVNLGANISHLDNRGRSMFEFHSSEMFGRFVQLGLSVDTRNSEGQSALMMCARNDFDAKRGEKPQSRRSEQQGKREEEDQVTTYINHIGEDIYDANDETARDALKLLDIFIEKGFDVNAKDSLGKTLLDYLLGTRRRRWCKSQIVALLVSVGAQPGQHRSA
ncbi:ankyrin repeat-containing domain protein [Podospora appendiculata]|uniref:Ankyrin repeat-containing domain protein n=1 Tax=Podospora appendiculata TaxID=314037 RepID=A0AAE1CBW3_9PEZI|nr:ankyrin repeat-containing domain protein [Podospora appendiculata]